MTELITKLLTVAILIIASGILKLILYYTKQTWSQTFSYTSTIFLLPLITYVITSVISGNIALSLGMIGALSIVRFRHPVKSALELIMYFDLITIGIATSVRTKWAIQLILGTILIIFTVKIVQKIYQKFGKSFYNVSFNEGISLNSIEIFAKEKIDLIEKDNNLTTLFDNSSEGEIIYRLTFENRNQLQLFKNKIEGLKSINKININLR